MFLTSEQLQGIFVPLVTPWDAQGRLDGTSLTRETIRLASAGVHGLVVGGTTGESPTITSEETVRLMALTLEAAAPYGLPVILGTGTNDTATTVRQTEQAAVLGASAALVVVPYYSRPSQEGILEHYRHAAAAGVPIIVYDVPYRTGVSLTTDTIRRLFEIDGIIGLKDCSGGTRHVTELAPETSRAILCGEDELFAEMLLGGARGGILASAIARTTDFLRVYELARTGQAEAAREQFSRLLPLIRLLFREPNPAPLKWLLARQGRIDSDRLRLPLMSISPGLQQELEAFVQE